MYLFLFTKKKKHVSFSKINCNILYYYKSFCYHPFVIINVIVSEVYANIH